jgi:hypothetical protein
MLHLFAFMWLLMAVLCVVTAVVFPLALLPAALCGLMWLGCEALAESLSPAEDSE